MTRSPSELVLVLVLCWSGSSLGIDIGPNIDCSVGSLVLDLVLAFVFCPGFGISWTFPRKLHAKRHKASFNVSMELIFSHAYILYMW